MTVHPIRPFAQHGVRPNPRHATLEATRPVLGIRNVIAKKHVPLTRAQRALLQKAQAIADLTKVDISHLEDVSPEFRLMRLQLAINRMVIAEIVSRYTLIDEILSDLIARYFFKVPKKSIHFQKLWRTKKFSNFSHHILDGIFLLKKMAIVQAIKPIPGEIVGAIHRINSIRNAFAHSFFPENRKEHRKSRKVYTRARISVLMKASKHLSRMLTWRLAILREEPSEVGQSDRWGHI